MDKISRIKNSFLRASKGQESFKIVAWIWGAVFYFFALFVLDPIIKKNFHQSINYSLSFFCIFYALWHIIIVVRCFPKLPKLTPEEIEQKKLKRSRILNSFGRKLFLQEPITKMNSRNVMVLCDLFIILHFVNFVF